MTTHTQEQYYYYSGDGNGDEDENCNEDRIGEGGGQAKNRKKPHKTCRRHVVNVGDLMGGKRKKLRKERVGLVASNPNNVENRKEARRGEHKVPRAQVRIVEVEKVCSLCRV